MKVVWWKQKQSRLCGVVKIKAKTYYQEIQVTKQLLALHTM